MSGPNIELELYGRIIVQLVKAEVIPAYILRSMEFEFDELSQSASSVADRAHFAELAMRVGLIVDRANIQEPLAP
ncbi:hypothetical protein [Sphingomonas montanisoli]|uniref:Uncharacterized protein n=1 Tax=Sphingomonas montanisoli TaxID=2606412 RepID=A0A5D9C3N0_9SPHN|nr:hypothetical protein [Sphingomonas montanisoli]TZG25580.1 hypothetical protein FYJ91_11165 [Sphingomonas montanisoli]